jgi:hypothetical protein
LAGLGWCTVGSSGQILERTIIDRTVGGPERLCFEGSPVVSPPLMQETAIRVPVAHDGELLDTRAECPPLTPSEQAQLERIRAADRAQLRETAAVVRKAYIADRAAELAARTGVSSAEAVRAIETQCHGKLLPGIMLLFDDPGLGQATVGDVLADPEKFLEATLADPIEGLSPGYGPDKAKLFRRADGSLIIHSFAHGGAVFKLCCDFSTAVAAVRTVDSGSAARVFTHCVLNGELDPTEVERLRNLTCETHKIGRRALSAMLKKALGQAAAARVAAVRDERQEQAAAGRSVSGLPRSNAEWQPIIQDIDEVLVIAQRPFPPLRDVENDPVETLLVTSPGLHLLTSEESNSDDKEGEEDDE